MDIPATLTSKGQITIPKSVRDALGLKEGDRVLFRVPKGGRYWQRSKTFSISPVA